MKQQPLTLVTGLLIAAIFAAMLFAFQVRQTEVVIVTTFGKYARGIDKPGINWRLPWPIQNIHRFDNRIRNFEKKYETTTTRDGRILMVDVFLGWKVKDPRVFLERFGGDVNRAEQNLEGLLRDTKNSIVGLHPLGDFISTDPKELKFDAIEKEMLTSIQPKAESNYGIQVAILGIKQIGLPEGITAKVFERMKAEREQLVKKFKGEGDGEALKIRSDADREREQLLSDARAKATVIMGEAEAQASSSLKIFEKNPDFAIFLLKLKALEESLKDKATLVLDPRTPPFDLLKGDAIPAAKP